MQSFVDRTLADHDPGQGTIGIVNLTQRPRRCHNTVMSEAGHSFVFRLQLETDIAKVKEILPKNM